MVDKSGSSEELADQVQSLVSMAQSQASLYFWPPEPEVTNVVAGSYPLARGLTLLSGATGSGKSTHGLSFALQIAEQMGLPLSFFYFCEPRSVYPDGSKMLGQNAREALGVLFNKLQGDGVPYAVLDSVTHVIPMLGLSLLAGADDVTMKEGLRRSDVLGTLELDAMARRAGLTVIATVNSELFPRPQSLEGACEGSMNITSFGHVSARGRLTRRETSLAIERRFLLAAATLMGYTGGETTPAPSTWTSVAL